jgi:hypothetical protein
MEPCWTKRAAKGMWYQSVSADVIPWCSASTVRVNQSAATTLTAITATSDAPRSMGPEPASSGGGSSAVASTGGPTSSPTAAARAGRRLPAYHPTDPTTASTGATAARRNRWMDPSTSVTTMTEAMPRTISARRATGPSHPGTRCLRHTTAAAPMGTRATAINTRLST